MDQQPSDEEITSGSALEIRDNRGVQKYSLKELSLRVLWMIGQYAFRWSPRTAFGWRRFVLRLFGAEVGRDVHIYNTVTIYYPWNLRIGDWSAIGEGALIYNLGPVTIGEQVTISQRAHLCAGTHDHTDPAMPLQKPPVVVESQAWVCADAYVGPGVVVGEGAIVGARAVAVQDVEDWTIVAGNPAHYIDDRTLQDA